MLYKLSMILFTILSHMFAYITVTDENNHCSFDVRKVKYIGKIEIDDLFIEYVLQRNCSCLCFQIVNTGKELQAYILDYVQEMVDETKKGRVYQIIYHLIHPEESEEKKFKIPQLISLLNTESTEPYDESD